MRGHRRTINHLRPALNTCELGLCAPQAAELDRAQEFKQATEGLAVCKQRLENYNAAANKLVSEKENRERKLMTVQGMFKKAQELVSSMRDLSHFLTNNIQQVPLGAGCSCLCCRARIVLTMVLSR